MNVSLANKIVKLTPKHILHPEGTAPSLDSPLPLSTGATIPAVGYAAWNPETAPDQVKDAVTLAIKSGYRHFDASTRHEAEVGAAIKEAVRHGKVKREDLFVTATARNYYLPDVQSSLDESLQNMGLDYVDLYLVDFEQDDFPQIWAAMEKLLATNKAKAIGVANVDDVHWLEKLLSYVKTIPTVISIITNLYEPQNEIIHLCHEKNIHVTAYSPFRSEDRGSLFNVEAVTKVADKHSAVPEKVLLSWHIARGSSVLVNEVVLGGSEGHRELLHLSEEDIAALDAVG